MRSLELLLQKIIVLYHSLDKYVGYFQKLGKNSHKSLTDNCNPQNSNCNFPKIFFFFCLKHLDFLQEKHQQRPAAQMSRFYLTREE